MREPRLNDVRDWIRQLESIGQLKRITAQVDWDEEVGAIVRKVSAEEGPALLFENIKGYQKENGAVCDKLFTNGLGSRSRVALSLRLPPSSDDRTITYTLKERYKGRVEPIRVYSGPVKENILEGALVQKRWADYGLEQLKRG